MIARCLSIILVVSVVVVAVPWRCRAAGPPPVMGVWDDTSRADGPWEVTLEGRLGFPVGRLKVGEFPTGANKTGGGGTPGTLLHFHTLGIDHSEVIDASAAFHFTPRDAVRAGFLYYFLGGSTKISGPSVVYNGQEFTTGSLDTNSDFYRLSLDYERTLFGRPWQHELIGTIGLTYVDPIPNLPVPRNPPAARNRTVRVIPRTSIARSCRFRSWDCAGPIRSRLDGSFARRCPAEGCLASTAGAPKPVRSFSNRHTRISDWLSSIGSAGWRTSRRDTTSRISFRRKAATKTRTSSSSLTTVWRYVSASDSDVRCSLFPPART